MEQYAIVVLCSGNIQNVDSGIIDRLVHLIPDADHVCVLNKQDIAKAVIQKYVSVDEDDKQTANAIIYIGEKFKRSLRESFIDFVQNFAIEISLARANGTDPKLIESVRIINKKKNLVKNKDLLEKYRMTPEVIRKILEIGTSC